MACNNKDIPLPVVYKYLLHDYRTIEQKNRDLHVELGKKESYIEELEDRCSIYENKIKELNDRINKYKEDNKLLNHEVKKETTYQLLRKEINGLRKEIKAVRTARDMAISRANSLETKIK